MNAGQIDRKKLDSPDTRFIRDINLFIIELTYLRVNRLVAKQITHVYIHSAVTNSMFRTESHILECPRTRRCEY